MAILLTVATVYTALHYVLGTAPRASPVLMRVILTTALYNGPQYPILQIKELRHS